MSQRRRRRSRGSPSLGLRSVPRRGQGRRNRRPIGKSSQLLSQLLCLRQRRILHRRFVGVEEHDVEVAVRVVAVLAQEATPGGPLPFGRLLPVLDVLASIVHPRRAELDDLYKAHCASPFRATGQASPAHGSDTSIDGGSWCPSPDTNQRGSTAVRAISCLSSVLAPGSSQRRCVQRRHCARLGRGLNAHRDSTEAEDRQGSAPLAVDYGRRPEPVFTSTLEDVSAPGRRSRRRRSCRYSTAMATGPITG